MKTPVAAGSSQIALEPFLTLFNLSQVVEIPLFPGFSRKRFKNLSTCFQSTFLPAAEPLHSRNPYCTAVFRTVPRNRIFLSSRFPSGPISSESTFRCAERRALNPFLHSVIRTLHSRNPHGTALFGTVPRNENFSRRLQSTGFFDVGP